MTFDKQIRNEIELVEHLNRMDWDAVIPYIDDAPPEMMKIIEQFLIENDERITEAAIASAVLAGYREDEFLGPEDLEASRLESVRAFREMN